MAFPSYIVMSQSDQSECRNLGHTSWIMHNRSEILGQKIVQTGSRVERSIESPEIWRLVRESQKQVPWNLGGKRPRGFSSVVKATREKMASQNSQRVRRIASPSTKQGPMKAIQPFGLKQDRSPTFSRSSNGRKNSPASSPTPQKGPETHRKNRRSPDHRLSPDRSSPSSPGIKGTLLTFCWFDMNSSSVVEKNDKPCWFLCHICLRYLHVLDARAKNEDDPI